MVQDRNKSHGPGGGGQRGAPEEHEIAVAINALKRSFETANNAQQEQHENQSKWTRRTAAAAIIYTFLTSVLLGTSGYTAYEATIASGAATKQAVIADDAEHRQLRAYISLDGANITKFDDAAPTEGRLVFKNYGSTPAYKVRAIFGAIEEDSFPKSRPFAEIKYPTVVEACSDQGPSSRFCLSRRVS
jgi:hypothetical protein